MRGCGVSASWALSECSRFFSFIINQSFSTLSFPIYDTHPQPFWLKLWLKHLHIFTFTLCYMTSSGNNDGLATVHSQEADVTDIAHGGEIRYIVSVYSLSPAQRPDAHAVLCIMLFKGATGVDGLGASDSDLSWLRVFIAEHIATAIVPQCALGDPEVMHTSFLCVYDSSIPVPALYTQVHALCNCISATRFQPPLLDGFWDTVGFRFLTPEQWQDTRDDAIDMAYAYARVNFRRAGVASVHSQEAATDTDTAHGDEIKYIVSVYSLSPARRPDVHAVVCIMLFKGLTGDDGLGASDGDMSWLRVFIAEHIATAIVPQCALGDPEVMHTSFLCVPDSSIPLPALCTQLQAHCNCISATRFQPPLLDGAGATVGFRFLTPEQWQDTRDDATDMVYAYAYTHGCE